MAEYVTATEAARELGISPGSLRTRLLRGHLRGIKAGPRAWLIEREELDRAKAVGRLRPGRRPNQKSHPAPPPAPDVQ